VSKAVVYHVGSISVGLRETLIVRLPFPQTTKKSTSIMFTASFQVGRDEAVICARAGRHGV
jgi:hypothetical protein